METKNHAPFLVTTLNRHEHLKRQLESLERCKGAEFTDVYVALDYPPSEKYVADWKITDAYLHEKEKSNGFKSLTVYRRTENYFFSGKGNMATLVRDLPADCNAFISSEDDNEFSPCFLEYMNQNLERYKDDNSVFRICGYLSFKESLPETGDYTQFKADRHVAWGTGNWLDKQVRLDYIELSRRENLHILYEDPKVIEYFEKDKLEDILNSMVRMARGGQMLGDVIVAAYMVYADCRCILPTKSMVRNHGWDGSGQHGGYVPGVVEQEIQTASDYVLNEAPAEFTEEYERTLHANRRGKRRDLNNLQALVTWKLYKHTGIFCEFGALRKVVKFFKKLFKFQKNPR